MHFRHIHSGLEGHIPNGQELLSSKTGDEVGGTDAKLCCQEAIWDGQPLPLSTLLPLQQIPMFLIRQLNYNLQGPTI